MKDYTVEGLQEEVRVLRLTMATKLEEARGAAYDDAKEKVITAFLSIMAGGFAEHVVMWNYEKLRDYLDGKAREG